MTQKDKLLYKVLCGTADTSISFSDLCRLLKYLDFEERVRGDHHIFTREGIAEILNLQPKGAQARPYQVRQVRNLILRYRLGGSDEN